MIYTFTLNPSVDYYMDIDNLAVGSLNRSSGESYVFGGKGINVSRMLKRLGCKSCAVALVGGFTGKALAEGLKEAGIELKPIYTRGVTRINVKLSKIATELNGKGTTADEESLGQLNKILAAINKGDTVILSGSVCQGIDKSIYGKIVSELNKKGVITIVDAEGELLLKAIEANPYLVKPNHIELGQIFDIEIKDINTAELCATKLLEKGVENILVSMGEKGAVLVNNSGTYFCKAPEVKPVNTVGAGDCLLAGYIYALENNYSYDKALQFAVICGSERVKTGDFPDNNVVNKIFGKFMS